jgi:hypothetical protein
LVATGPPLQMMTAARAARKTAGIMLAGKGVPG